MSPALSQNPPPLAPPGAGLPLPELLVARLLVRWGRWRTTRQQAVENFARGRDEIVELTRGCDAATGAQRVLIRRLPGMEDSSRFWSVFMTLDHLRIVNDAVAAVVSALVCGQVPSRRASTADVKPSPDAGIAVFAAFEESCRQFEQTIAAVPNLATRAKYAHPWFGPLDAAGWHHMAGFHMNLHRKQIVSILAGISRAP